MVTCMTWAFDMAVVMTAKPPSILVAEAERLLLSGSLATASTLLEEYLVDHPEETPVLRALARVRMLQGRPEDAADLLERTLAVLRNGILAHRRVNGHPGLDQAVLDSSSGADDDAPSSSDFTYIEQRAYELRTRRAYYDYESEETGASTGAPPRKILADSGRKTVEVPMRQSDAPSDFSVPLTEKATLSPDGAHSEVDLAGAEVSAELEQVKPVPDALVPDSDDLIDLQESSTDDETASLDPIEITESFVGYSDGAPERPSIDITHDWDAIDPYLFDFDETPAREELEQEVQTDGKIDRKQRALQEAISLGSRFGWDESDIYLLAEVFDKYWWNSAKRSMARELEAGLIPDELKLALVVREMWQQYEEFSINLDGYPYTALSWPVALKIVRSFHSFPEPEEIEMFLLEGFNEWQMRGSLTQTYRSYVDYLVNRLSFPNDRYMVSPSVTLESDYDWSEDAYLSSSNVGLNNPEFQSLVEYGLIPDIWTDPFTVVTRKNGEDGADAEGEDDE